VKPLPHRVSGRKEAFGVIHEARDEEADMTDAAMGARPGAGRPGAPSGTAAERDRRAEWLALAGRAVRADQEARSRRSARAAVPAQLSGRVVLMDHAIGARSLARVESDARVRQSERAAAFRSGVPVRAARGAPAVQLTLLVLGCAYGLAMAVLTAVAVARYATTAGLGLIGPLAFGGVFAGFAVLTAVVTVSAVRTWSARRR
jgi:hypothetical protein